MAGPAAADRSLGTMGRDAWAANTGVREGCFFDQAAGCWEDSCMTAYATTRAVASACTPSRAIAAPTERRGQRGKCMPTDDFDELVEWDDASEDVGDDGTPLLALPRYTLFPDTLVPFHVFDIESQRMLDDAVAGQRLMVVAGLTPGWEHDPNEPPPTHEFAGLGRILRDRRYSDGRYDLFVHGIARVRIDRVVQTHPYPTVDITRLPDFPADLHDTLDVVGRLVGLMGQLMRALGPDADTLSQTLGATVDPGPLSNRLAAMLVESPRDRQALLEERDPLARCRFLCDLVGSLVLERGPEHRPGVDLLH